MTRTQTGRENGARSTAILEGLTPLLPGLAWAHMSNETPGDPGAAPVTNPETLIGTRVGRFRIVDLIARGGMGEVWVAFDEKLERKVALKSIRRDLRLDEAAQGRFLREARVLSRLGHPNICQIHDYVEGEQADFLVLELIDGRRLGEVLRKGVSPRLAMRIAHQVASVLVAAHEEGVIHRDLKPDNVLITPGEEVKVLDFGLSRWLARETTAVIPRTPHEQPRPRPAASTEPETIPRDEAHRTGDSPITAGELTTRGTIMGTVGYMSPEQAKGQEATAASDMYSFGLLLQEIFTGKPPFEPGLDSATQLRNTQEGKTLPLSGLDPDLARLIRRLESVSSAARPSAVDAAERLVWIRDKPARRRKRLLLAASIVGLTVFGAGMTVQTFRARRAERHAQQAAKAAEQVSDFLVGVFRVADPNTARGSSVTARELLDQGAQRVRRDLSNQPAVQSRVMGAIGSVYLNLGLYAEAQPLLDEALALNEKALGPVDPEVARSLQSLSNLYRARGLWAQAEPLVRRCLAIREQALGPDHPDVALALNLVGALDTIQGRYAEAEPLFRRALAIQEKALGPAHPELVRTLSNLADLNRNQGRLAEAEPLARRALAIHEKALGPEHPLVAYTLTSLAVIERRLGKLAEAETLSRRVLTIREKVLGPDHPDVAGSLNNLAAVLLDRGDQQEAEPLFRRSLAIYEKVLGPEHPTVASSLANLASLLVDLDRLADAEPLALRSLAIREKVLRPGHPDLARSLGVVAGLRLAQGRLVEAESLGRRSLAILEAALGPDHPEVASSLQTLADALHQEGKDTEAETVLRRGLAIQEKALGRTHPAVGEIAWRLARLTARRGERLEAVEWLRRAIECQWCDPIIARDPDLASLRGDPDFERLVAEVTARAR